MKSIPVTVAVLVLMGLSVCPALAELCGKCKQMVYTADIGKCVNCGGMTSSGAFRLCKACSAKLGQCEHCRGPIGDKDKSPPPPAEISDKDAGKTVKTVVGQQIIAHMIAAEGWTCELSKVEGDAVRQGKVHPGRMIIATFESVKGGKATLTFRQIPPASSNAAAKTIQFIVKVKPVAVPAQVILTEANEGKTAATKVGQIIEVRLQGNATTGFAWRVKKLEGASLEQQGEIQYEPTKAAAKRVGTGGTYIATFKAMKEGKATINLAYARSWEKGTAPVRELAVSVEVKAGESPASGPSDKPAGDQAKDPPTSGPAVEAH